MFNGRVQKFENSCCRCAHSFTTNTGKNNLKKLHVKYSTEWTVPTYNEWSLRILFGIDDRLMSHTESAERNEYAKNRGRHRRMPIKNTGRRKSHVAKIECKTGRFLRVWRTQHLSNKRPHTKKQCPHLAHGLLLKSLKNDHKIRNSYRCL